MASVVDAHTAITDEIVHLFDRALSKAENSARKEVTEIQKAIAAGDVDRLRLLDEMIVVIRDENLNDADVGRRLRGFGPDRLATAQRSIDEWIPRDNGLLMRIAARYRSFRNFTPKVLAAIEFEASIDPSEILIAVEVLRDLNEQRTINVPDDAPVGFVPSRWQPYLEHTATVGDRVAHRHYWELCVLYELRDALRSGEIWVRRSRRYANPASYLIPADQWPRLRLDTLERTGQAATFDERRERLDDDYAEFLDILDDTLATDTGPIRLDNAGQLHLSPLTAEVLPAHIDDEHRLVERRLPDLQLPEIFAQVDGETGFTSHLTHATGAKPRADPVRHQQILFAAVMAQACNFGVTRMAQLSGISADTLDHYTRWYLREDSLKAANRAIINAHHRHPLAAIWGGGTLSSSDGMRLPMQGDSITARRLSRYFVDEGVTAYLHVSDQHTTYGTQIIVSTERDATFTLDEILGNTTELAIAEHTTDSHGQTLATFALFDLVGLRLSPRIAQLTNKRLWRPHTPSHYHQWPHAGPLLVDHAQIDLIERHWDDLLRIAGSLKSGHVSAELLVTRLQAGSRTHPLSRALVEYGKLLYTVHALRWFTDETFRRRIGRQLNKGEAMNDLRHYLSFAHRERIRHRHHDDQTMQALCLTVATNACIMSTTSYLYDAIQAERAAGNEISDEAIAHLSPARFAQINPFGIYNFDTSDIPRRHPLKDVPPD